MKYDLDYFINKFENIPDEKWSTEGYIDEDRYCAYGHCGVVNFKRDTEESRCLLQIDMEEMMSNKKRSIHIVKINDDTNNTLGFGETAKERVVNYLKSLK